MPVNKGRVRLLVAALRSGLYEKTHAKLHRTESRHEQPEGWCCLGVASDVAHKFGLQLTREPGNGPLGDGCEVFDGERDYMPRSVQEWYGFESNNPRLQVDGKQVSAATLNDSGYLKEGENDYTEVSLDDIGRFFKDTFLKKQKKS